MTLRSSAPTQLPVVQKIELDMSVFPPTTEDAKDGLAYHTYTQMQSEMGAQPITSEGDPFWRERYPDLAFLYDGDGPPRNSEVVLLESNLELMKTFCPQRSKLGIHLYADLISDGAYKTWHHRTFFREDGATRNEFGGRIGSSRTHNSTTTRVELSLFSSWWVGFFQDILNRRHAIEISGDLEELQEHEDQTREEIRSRSVVQEIFASTQDEGHEYPLPGEPVVTFLWKFRQTRPGEAATTSWRKLHVSPPQKLMPIDLHPPLTASARAQLLTNHLELPLPSSQMPLPEPLQNGARWDEWCHVSRDPYAKSTDSMIMNVPRELYYKKSTDGMIMDFQADQSTQTGTSLYPDQPLFQATSGPTYSVESYDNHYDSRTAYTAQQPENYFSASHLGTLNFTSHSADHQSNSFSSDDAAATILTDFASQGAMTEFSSQSTTADIASHLDNTDLSTESALGYSQGTTDPSLDDFTNCQIELSFQHTHPQEQSQATYDEATLLAPVADMVPTHARLQHNEQYHAEQGSHEQLYHEQQQQRPQYQGHEHHQETYTSQKQHTGNYDSTACDMPSEARKQDYANSFYDIRGDHNHDEVRDIMLRVNATYHAGFDSVISDSHPPHEVEPGMTFVQFEQYKAQHDQYLTSHKVDWREMLKKQSDLVINCEGDPATQAERFEAVVARMEGMEAQVRGRASEKNHTGERETSGQGKVLGDLEEGKEELGEDVR